MAFMTLLASCGEGSLCLCLRAIRDDILGRHEIRSVSAFFMYLLLHSGPACVCDIREKGRGEGGGPRTTRVLEVKNNDNDIHDALSLAVD